MDRYQVSYHSPPSEGSIYVELFMLSEFVIIFIVSVSIPCILLYIRSKKDNERHEKYKNMSQEAMEWHIEKEIRAEKKKKKARKSTKSSTKSNSKQKTTTTLTKTSTTSATNEAHASCISSIRPPGLTSGEPSDTLLSNRFK
ncbi:unnamed protein product [Caenorhabditis auriculariae]|uniref:Uncharacterized protein n=1 Tax=Caenorhabditis auriculariae TaxID=2777116 RepID=A0A8S1HHT8_9PELO|nr:unnamed protein product [Caenorhabditis auriculariae]